MVDMALRGMRIGLGHAAAGWVLAGLAAGTVHAADSTAGLETLLADADLVVMAEILSTDSQATASDGPMSAEAKVLKVVKGRATESDTLRFGAGAWLGPTYKKGELRILFLARMRSGDAYYGNIPWASLETGKAEVFFAKDAVERCSEETLSNVMKSVRGGGWPPPRVEFK